MLLVYFSNDYDRCIIFYPTIFIHPILHARRCTHAVCDSVCIVVKCNIIDNLEDIVIE